MCAFHFGGDLDHVVEIVADTIEINSAASREKGQVLDIAPKREAFGWTGLVEVVSRSEFDRVVTAIPLRLDNDIACTDDIGVVPQSAFKALTWVEIRV